MKKITIDENFESILICAVRYCLGRQTYMPKLVVDYITPLISDLSDKTISCLEKDIIEAKDICGYGDKNIDEPIWMKFLADIKSKIKRRERLIKEHERNK